MPAPSRQAEEDAEANYLSAMEQVAAWTAQALVNPEQVETLHKTELLPEIPTTEPENPDTPQYSDSPAPEVPQLSTDGEIQANQGEAQTASPQLQSFYEALESVEVKVPQAPTPQDPAVGRDALGTPQTAIPETAGRDALGTPQAETANPVGRDALGTPLKTPDAPLTETADPAGRDSPGAPQTAKPVGRDALGTPLETLSAPLVSEEASTEKAQTQITAEQEKPLNEAELKAPLNPLNIKGKPDEMNELLERFKASEAAKEAVSAQGQVQHIDPKPVVTGKEISIFPQAETARIADEIIARIATKEGGVITFEMTLNPVELGKITIKIVMSGDSVTADITAQEENTAKLLQNATDKIQAQLDKESVKLEQFTVKHEPDYSDRQENQNGNKQQHEQKPKSEDEDIEISFAELMQSM
jgi:flagellar hook-length control protein FliK